MKKMYRMMLILLCVCLLASTAFAEVSSNLEVKTKQDPNNRRTSSETYVDEQGKPVSASDKGYATVCYTYNGYNLVNDMRYLDEEGNLTDCAGGYARVKYTYDVKNLIKVEYSNAEGQPAAGPEGYATREYTRGTRGLPLESRDYDAEGNLVRRCVTEYDNIRSYNRVKSESWYGADGKPTAGPNGYARVSYEYNKKITSHITYYNADGGLYLNLEDGFAEMKQVYDKGRLKTLLYRGADGELMAGPNGFARAEYTYANKGKEVLTMYYNADGSLFFTKKGYCGILQIYKDGRVAEERYFSGEGVRGNCKDGYSRTTKMYTARGLLAVQYFYDVNDKPVCPPGLGYAKIKNSYTNKYITKTEYFDEQQRPTYGPDGYAVAEYKYYDKLLSELVFYGADGKTPVNCKAGYAKVRYSYMNKQCVSEVYVTAGGNRAAVNGEADELRFGWNRNGQKISESYWQDGKAANCAEGYHEVRTEYQGKKKVKAQSFFDAEGNPTVCNDGYARLEKLYSSKGKTMATLYYDTEGALMTAPGKEYAYMMTIPAQEKTALDESEAAEEGPLAGLDLEEEEAGTEGTEAGAEEDGTDEEEETITIGTVYVEYYGTDRKLMNLAAGYARIIRQTDGKGRTTGEVYYDQDGAKVVLKNGYDEYRRTYNDSRNSNRTVYYLEGKPALRTEGYCEVEKEYDEAGRVIREAYFGTESEPVMCQKGYEAIRKTYDADGRVDVEMYYNRDGEPMANAKGVYRTGFEYNENGKAVRETYYDSEGQAMNCADGYAGKGKIYSETGRTLATLYYGLDGALTTTPGKEYAYEMKIPEDEKAGMLVFENDEEEEEETGGVFFIEYYGTDEKLMNLEAGYAYMIRETDEQGRVISEIYFDKDGKRAVRKEGYDEKRQFFEDGKKPVRIEYYAGGEPALCSNGYAALTRVYDEKGNNIEERYYGTDGEPIKRKTGFEMVRREYNENGQVVTEAYFNHEGKPMKNKNKKGAYRVEYEYGDDGEVVKETRYDKKGNVIE